jgi:hypothetical protein
MYNGERNWVHKWERCVIEGLLLQAPNIHHAYGYAGHRKVPLTSSHRNRNNFDIILSQILSLPANISKFLVSACALAWPVRLIWPLGPNITLRVRASLRLSLSKYEAATAEKARSVSGRVKHISRVNSYIALVGLSVEHYAQVGLTDLVFTLDP